LRGGCRTGAVGLGNPFKRQVLFALYAVKQIKIDQLLIGYPRIFRKLFQIVNDCRTEDDSNRLFTFSWIWVFNGSPFNPFFELRPTAQRMSKSRSSWSYSSIFRPIAPRTTLSGRVARRFRLPATPGLATEG